MKTRQSFVANSSSSSFIIGCKAVPSTVEEAGTIWFGNKSRFIAPVILEALFAELKVVDINLDSLLNKAKSIYNINKFWHMVPKDEDCDITCEEWKLIYALSYKFHNEELYGRENYYSSNEPTELEMYIDEKVNKLIETEYPTAKNKYEIPWLVRQKIEDNWFRRKSVKELFIKEIEYFISTIQGYSKDKNTVFMTGIFADEDGPLGCECEHGSHWEKFPSYVRFSNH